MAVFKRTEQYNLRLNFGYILILLPKSGLDAL